MVKIDLEKCTGCKTCEQACQVHAIKVTKKKARSYEDCVSCGACVKVCPEGALTKGEISERDTVVCSYCPVGCAIQAGKTGACLRYVNDGEKIVRKISPVQYRQVAGLIPKEYNSAITKPLITGMGAGTTSPDFRPAPYIVRDKVDGVDVVTCVTECPFTVNGMKVKIDTDLPIGEEGSAVTYIKRRVGMVTTEEYNAPILALGGLRTTGGENGIFSAKVITDIANKKQVALSVKGGAKIMIQVGQPPIINGIIREKIAAGCGSATVGVFSPLLVGTADEVIILDHQLTGLFSAHATGKYFKVRPSGIVLKYRESTPGRYFGVKGNGIGGTNIVNPIDVIDTEKSKIRPGLTLLVTEPTGEFLSLLRFENGGFNKITPTPQVLAAVNEMRAVCEKSRVSAMFVGGAGGASRSGITKKPLKLTEAIKERKAKLTIGGASTFIMPGGGITFVVDVEHVQSGFYHWVPTPAVVAPMEYTMTLEDYIAIGGHAESIRPLSDVIEEIEKVKEEK
jgi:6-hydroxynicotinate reductase